MRVAADGTGIEIVEWHGENCYTITLQPMYRIPGPSDEIITLMTNSKSAPPTSGMSELERRLTEAKAAGGEARIERQHAAGKLTARERIDLLLDKVFVGGNIAVNAGAGLLLGALRLAGKDVASPLKTYVGWLIMIPLIVPTNPGHIAETQRR